MTVTISKRSKQALLGRGRTIRIREKTYGRLQAIKKETGREITEIMEIAVQQLRVGRAEK